MFKTSHSQVGWHLSRLRPKQKQSIREFEWWVGLSDAEKEGEFSWVLDPHETTLWEGVNVEDGSSHPHCGTMDASQTLRGVDCKVGQTDTAARTILCETGQNMHFMIYDFKSCFTGIFCQGDRRVQPEGCRCMGGNLGELVLLVLSNHLL